MSEKSLTELIQEQFEADSMQLPVFNRVALELQRMKGDPRLTLAQISTVILKDPSLASRILKVANSSFYTGLRRVDTVSKAVERLGLERVNSLAMVASQLLAHSARIKLISECMGALWSHSFASAVGGRWIAIQIGRQAQAEEIFLAGLLHDIGALFLLKVLEKLALDREHPLPLNSSLIREVVDSLHPDMGYQLMRKWQLPEAYAQVARDHHLDQFDDTNELLMVTRLLNITCQKLGIGQPAEPDIVLAATPEARALGLKDIKLAEFEIMLEDTVGEAGALLKA